MKRNMSKSGREVISQWDPLVLTKTWSAVEGTRTSAHTPEGVSVLSGEVLKELALRRLLVEKKTKNIQCKTSIDPAPGSPTHG